MYFDQLVTFLQVAKLGSFSRAGRKSFFVTVGGQQSDSPAEQEYGDKTF